MISIGYVILAVVSLFAYIFTQSDMFIIMSVIFSCTASILGKIGKDK